MARPKKQEVTYFPHYVEHGRVLFILEDRWGNDGYAAFYRLMELLGKTEGHCYDCSDAEDWEFMLSVIRVSEVIAVSILDKLALMGVIDPALWGERKVWMQSFVDSIADVYARRKVDLPTKPPTSPGLMYTETPLSGINDVDNPQSKVNKSKVNKSICNRGVKTPRFAPPSISDIENYCRESGRTIDVQMFHDFYTSKGWMVGKNKMKDWKAAVRNWGKRNETTGHGGWNRSVPPYEPDEEQRRLDALALKAIRRQTDNQNINEAG